MIKFLATWTVTERVRVRHIHSLLDSIFSHLEKINLKFYPDTNVPSEKSHNIFIVRNWIRLLSIFCWTKRKLNSLNKNKIEFFNQNGKKLNFYIRRSNLSRGQKRVIHNHRQNLCLEIWWRLKLWIFNMCFFSSKDLARGCSKWRIKTWMMCI